MGPGPIDDDDAVFAKLRVQFVERFAERLKNMEAELARANESRERAVEAMECIRAGAHRLRGAGATFGFSSVSEIAGDLEDYLDSWDENTEPEKSEINHFINRLRTELELAEQQVL